jgi:DnaJ-class molecular chaperone
MIPMPKWSNPNNIMIPPIMFQVGCKKCHGSGTVHKRGVMIPCRVCYRKNQICPKCYGSGFNFFNNKPCKKCQGGRWHKKHGRRSSSSSSS